MMKLIGHEFSIAHSPGKKNGLADTLSRRPQAMVELGALLSCLEEVRKDHALVRIWQALEEGTTTSRWFSLEESKLFYKGRYVLSKSSPFIPIILREYHDSPMGDHSGELKTYLRVAAKWYSEGMRGQINCEGL